MLQKYNLQDMHQFIKPTSVITKPSSDARNIDQCLMDLISSGTFCPTTCSSNTVSLAQFVCLLFNNNNEFFVWTL